MKRDIMGYSKKIVCLANSKKISGRCIAGKELIDGNYTEWIRPISERTNGEISEDERQFKDGKKPQVLDIITIPFIKHCPHNYQQENHLIDDKYWEKKGMLSWSELQNVVDTVPDTLWINGDSSNNGINDRISELKANSLESSLLLIQPDTLTISVGIEGAKFGNGKRKVRAIFTLNNHEYKLVVTDPRIESRFLKNKDNQYELNAGEVYMCISIGEPFHDYCYKLVASIIFKPSNNE